jgi:DNA polymerase epsilon subunit 2
MFLYFPSMHLVSKEREEGDRSEIDADRLRSLLDRGGRTTGHHASSSSSSRAMKSVFQVIHANDVPRFRYQDEKKRFFRVSDSTKLFGTAEEKRQMYSERWHLVKQRLLRHSLFRQKRVFRSGEQAPYQLTTIEALLGTTEFHYILGMLTQVEEGSWYLEDISGRVKCDFTQAGVASGFFTETSLILAEGRMLKGVLRVSVVGFPVAEPRKDSMEIVGSENIFGGDAVRLSGEDVGRIKDRPILCLSDVFLDDPRVMRQLNTILDRFEACDESILPLVFVLCGDFLHAPFGSNPDDRTRIGKLFLELANKILSHRKVANSCRFVFVPGPGDPSVSGKVLPYGPVASSLTQEIRERLPSAIFTTNPCRIRLADQEIIVFRENTLSLLRRHSIFESMSNVESDSDLTQSLVKTIVDQGHLCPLPLPSKPIAWNVDHTLRLFPLPHTLILADRCKGYTWTYMGCRCVNPGSFASENRFIHLVADVNTDVDLYEADTETE